MKVKVCPAQPCPTYCNPTDCSQPDSSVGGGSPGKDTRVGSHGLLHGIFLTPGFEPESPALPVQILYHLSHLREFTMLKHCVAISSKNRFYLKKKNLKDQDTHSRTIINYIFLLIKDSYLLIEGTALTLKLDLKVYACRAKRH